MVDLSSERNTQDSNQDTFCNEPTAPPPPQKKYSRMFWDQLWHILVKITEFVEKISDLFILI